MGVVLSRRNVKKTKKQHQCCVCDLMIVEGSPAIREVNVGYDWGFCSIYQHEGCTPIDEEYY
jgi:hypothetical protein